MYCNLPKQLNIQQYANQYFHTMEHVTQAS